MPSSNLRAAFAARFFPAARAAPFVSAALPFSALLLVGCATEPAPAALPRLTLDPQRVAVAGLSSGAYMATQAHLALGERIHGAALIAGGPYGCAGGELGQALGACIKAEPAPPDVDALLARVRERDDDGRIAPIDALAGDRVLVLHGRADAVVAGAVSAASAELYRRLADHLDPPLALAVDINRGFGHTMPTLDHGADCTANVSPFLGRCGFDAAGLVFESLFGLPPVGAASAATGEAPQAAAPTGPDAAEAAPAGEAVAGAGGELRAFDQRAYRAAEADPQLADTGYLYLPSACAAGEPCGLLVVFHGCEQNAEAIGDTFVREAGFNRWADRYGVAVLYPQTRASFVPLNPKACWDWWGYTGPDYDTRHGAQLRWLDAVLTALGLSEG